MKKLVILIVLLCLMAGCNGMLEKDSTGNSPALDTVAKLRTANAASSPINPYSGWIELGLGIATVALGGSYLGKRKELRVAYREKKVTSVKYAAHKLAMNEISASMTPEKQAQLYENIGQHRKAIGI